MALYKSIIIIIIIGIPPENEQLLSAHQHYTQRCVWHSANSAVWPPTVRYHATTLEGCVQYPDMSSLVSFIVSFSTRTRFVPVKNVMPLSTVKAGLQPAYVMHTMESPCIGIKFYSKNLQFFLNSC